jgi:RNA polymerase sigma-70 factor, ECF subfamily
MDIEKLKQNFEKIYRKEADGVWRFCLWKTSNQEIAVDLTQETFMRFWDELAKGGLIKNDKAFLFTVARRLIIDWYRKKRAESLERLAESFDEDPFETPDEKTLGPDLGAEARYIVEKIKNMHPSYRQAIYLRFVEGLDTKDIAEVLGVSSNIASTRIHRGMKELKEMVNPEKTNI